MFSTAKLLLALALVIFYAGVAFGNDKTIKVVGDRFYHPKCNKEYLQTYVRLPRDHTSRTRPIAVGVELTDGFIRAAAKLPKMLELDIPIGPNTAFHYAAYEQAAAYFPMVGTNPFVSLYWSYGFNGHPPVGVYDVPHFDFHLMFPSYDYWWNQEWNPQSHGPCMGASNETFFKSFTPIPASCWPGDVKGPITQVGDFVWGMGSHLFDFSGPEFNPTRRFNFTQIYGQYDGKIQFFEAMISTAVMKRNKGYKECRQLVNNPKAMSVARDIPAQLCLEKKAKTFTFEYRQFAPVAGGCDTGSGVYAGGYPATAPPLPANLCTVPSVPSTA